MGRPGCGPGRAPVRRRPPCDRQTSPVSRPCCAAAPRPQPSLHSRPRSRWARTKAPDQGESSSGLIGSRATWWQAHGAFFDAGTDPALPAVFLIHWNHETAKDWTKSSTIEQHYNCQGHPRTKKLGKEDGPNAGIYKVAASP